MLHLDQYWSHKTVITSASPRLKATTQSGFITTGSSFLVCASCLFGALDEKIDTKVNKFLVDRACRPVARARLQGCDFWEFDH